MSSRFPDFLHWVAGNWPAVSAIAGWMVTLVVMWITLRRNHKHAERLFRKQVEYACYSRLAASLVALAHAARSLWVDLTMLAFELHSAIRNEGEVMRLEEAGRTAESDPNLWAMCRRAEGNCKRWRAREQELLTRNLALSSASGRFEREYEHHEIFIAALIRPKEDVGRASLRLFTQVGDLHRLLFKNTMADPPYPAAEQCGALCTEARRLAAEAFDVVSWAGQTSRLLQNLVLSDVAGRMLPPRKVGSPDLVVMTTEGLCRAASAGLFDPQVAARANELSDKGTEALWEALPTNHPKETWRDST
jgi:hypothetical protein